MLVIEADNADRAMRMAARHLLNNEGNTVPSRVGETREETMVMIRIEHPWEREIISPSRKASIAAQIAETMWVLAGRSDVGWLSHYLPRAKDFSDDGVKWRAGYGPRLRNWQAEMSSDGCGTDQITEVVGLLREDPETRRAVMSIFDPGADYANSRDIPCNNWLHFLSRGDSLDLHVATRSNDLIWGWSGINAFEWSVLLEIVAGMTGLRVGQMYFSISSLHLYSQHYSRAGAIVGDRVLTEREQPKASPRFSPTDPDNYPYPAGMDSLITRWFAAEELIRTGSPQADLAVESFPEPMMRSWLLVLRWWWTGDKDHLEPLRGTRLWVAAHNGVQPKRVPREAGDALLDYATMLHAEKHKAYGDSWRRRGEVLGIQANIARKVDRLGVPGAGDTNLDTAVDLWVYCAKYVDWLRPNVDGEGGDYLTRVSETMGNLRACSCDLTQSDMLERHIVTIRKVFDMLLSPGTDETSRADLAGSIGRYARALAQHYWRESEEKKQKWFAANLTRAWKGYGEG